MKHRKYQPLRRFITAILIAVTSPFLATAEHQLPPGARSLANNADITVLLRSAIADSALGAAEYDEKSGVWKLSTLVTNTDRWKNRVTLKDPVATTVAPGEIMHFSLEARVTFPFPATDYGSLTITLQSKLDKKYETIDLLKTFQPTLAWQRFDFVAPAIRSDYAPENIYFALAYGLGPQTLEIRNVRAEVYPVGTRRESLPETKFTYAGREADAKWRTEAQKRIAENRQSDFSILFKGADGKPQAGLKASLKLVNPEFGFGCAYLSRKGPVMGNKEENTKYYEEFYRLFNFATPEHELTAPAYFNKKGTGSDVAAAATATLEAQKIPVYGHVLFWPMWHYQPFTKEEKEAYLQNIPALKQRLLDLARTRLADLKGKIVAWNATNEIQWQREILDVLNAGGVSDADMVESLLRLAREVDPHAKLVINETGLIEHNAVVSQVKKDYYLKLVSELKQRGAPLDGFGFQSHFGAVPNGIEAILKTFDIFANLGLRLYITEFDVASEDEQLVADFTRDFYTVAYSHPAMDGITAWGFWSGAHFTPQGSLFRKDWSGRPVLAVYESLRKEWSTQLPELTTDSSGSLRFRGFPGEYQISLKNAAGDMKLARLTLTAARPAATFVRP